MHSKKDVERSARRIRKALKDFELDQSNDKARTLVKTTIEAMRCIVDEATITFEVADRAAPVVHCYSTGERGAVFDAFMCDLDDAVQKLYIQRSKVAIMERGRK